MVPRIRLHEIGGGRFGSVIAGLLQALCMTCGPLALAVLLQRRWKVPWRLFGIGLFAFTVSKVIQVPLQIWTRGNIVQLAAPLQFGIMLLFAPLCEELARYAAFRWFANNARSFRESVFVGIGHGGFEAIFFGVLVGINVVGATQIPAEAANALLAQKLLNAPTGIRVLAVLERAEAMTFHCAASWLVMRVFVTGKLRYLLYAMVLHLLLNGILIGAAPRLGLTGMIALGLLVGLVPLVILLVAGKQDQTVREKAFAGGPKPDRSMAISCRNLSRSFGEVVAFEDVDLDIKQGELFALLGPNGAGKTTLVRTLSALIPPSSGAAAVAGHRLTDEDENVRADVGVLTEVPGLYESLSAEANLRIFGALEGLEEPRLSERIETLLRHFELWDRRGDRVGSFSKGMRQKVSIARAMIHEPPILFLDEPTSGLDPSAARDMRALINALKEKGHTILLTTHRLVEAEQLADRVGIIRRKLLVVDTLDRLKNSLSGQQVHIRVMNPEPSWEERLAQLPGIANVTLNDQVFSVTLNSLDQQVPTVIRELSEAGAQIRSVQDAEDSLEDVYLQMLRDTDNDTEGAEA